MLSLGAEHGARFHAFHGCRASCRCGRTRPTADHLRRWGAPACRAHRALSRVHAGPAARQPARQYGRRGSTWSAPLEHSSPKSRSSTATVARSSSESWTHSHRLSTFAGQRRISHAGAWRPRERTDRPAPPGGCTTHFGLGPQADTDLGAAQAAQRALQRLSR